MKYKFCVPAMNKIALQFSACILFMLLSSCGVYTFRDVSIDYTKIKTVKINFIENKAPYKNPQLSPRVTDALRQKITSYTKLTPTQSDDASYIISGYISNYSVTTSAISGQQAAANRLSVAAHMTLLNTVDNKTQEFDVSRDFDFSASLSLTQAEGPLMPDIVKNMSDEIFNRLFSNW
jgi:basic membrane lipoprotein Med (substrate-binding protein (PBP1-ABC) superfamily)